MTSTISNIQPSSVINTSIGPTGVQAPAAELNARVSRVALPAIANFSKTMAAGARMILNAVLFIPRLIGSTIAKIMSCAFSCLISKADNDAASVESESTNGSREAPLLTKAPSDAESLEEYVAILKNISHKPLEERTQKLYAKPPIFYRNAHVDYANASKETIKAAALHQFGRDLLAVLNSEGNYRTLTVNGTLYRLAHKLSAVDSTIAEQNAATRPVVEAIYNTVDAFYREIQPGLSDDARLAKVILVLDNINQGSGTEARRVGDSLSVGQGIDFEYGPVVPSDTSCDPMNINLEMNRAQGTVRIVNTYAMPILTVDAMAMGKQAVAESLGTFKAVTVINITTPEASQISYEIAMK